MQKYCEKQKYNLRPRSLGEMLGVDLKVNIIFFLKCIFEESKQNGILIVSFFPAWPGGKPGTAFRAPDRGFP